MTNVESKTATNLFSCLLAVDSRLIGILTVTCSLNHSFDIKHSTLSDINEHQISYPSRFTPPYPVKGSVITPTNNCISLRPLPQVGRL